MSEVPEHLKHRISELTKYQPNDAVKRNLMRTSWLGIVGPSAVGKNVIIDSLVASDSANFAKAWSFTNRSPRPDDTTDMIHYVDNSSEALEEVCYQVESGNFVNFKPHPTTGVFYGTYPESFQTGKINIMPALSSSVAEFEQLPFQNNYAIGLVAPYNDWRRWFDARPFATPDERSKRLAEGVACLDWLIESGDAPIVVNTSGHPSYAVEDIKLIIEGNQPPRGGLATAKSLRKNMQAQLEREQ